MKNSPTPVICVLICLLPALLIGQVSQGQNQKLITGSSLRALQANSSRSMSVSPLLRISNIGSSGQDGVSIELNDLTLLNPGPSLLFDFPALGSTAGSDIKLQPGNGRPYLMVRNIGSSGQDGVGLRVNNLCCLDSFFDVFYNLRSGTETHKYGITGDPDFDLLRITTYDRTATKLSERIMSGNPVFAPAFFDITYDIPVGIIGTGFGNTPQDMCSIMTYDKQTPKLAERVTSGNPSALGFFDITYDLSVAQRRVGFGTDPNNLCCITTFDKATPKLAERVTSDVPTAHGFFDISYDLNLGRETHAHGDPDFDLLVSRSYDRNLRRLKDSIYSHNLGTNSFFDISYDLALGTETQIHGDPDFDLLRVNTFDKATPKLEEKIYSRLLEDEGIWYNIHNLHTGEYTVQYRESDFDFVTKRKFDVDIPKLTEDISCTNPMAHGFFDMSYDLYLGRESRAFRILPGDPDFDLIVVRNWDKTTPKLQETISSSNPILNNSFFDITYDLAAKSSKIKFNEVVVTKTFDSATPKLLERIESTNPTWANSFFDITYDLSAKYYKIMLEDLIVSSYYYPATPKFQQKISSSLLPYVESFFDITYDISDTHLQKQSTKAHAEGGMMPLEMRYEYDALSRKIREVSTDLQTPAATLTLERRLSPTGSSLFVSDKLEVQGALSTPGAGPLVITDNVLINGTSHQIIGNTQVNGNLTVNGIFSSTNKFFKIDHPLDPDHKYLIHSCVESPDMMNVYNGNAVTDNLGYVTIILPDYFEALNNDFRYQLTCMGQFAQAIVAEKIKNNKFVIRTDKPEVEVSWQVTGIRNDPASNRKTYAVEVIKEPEMEGKRLYNQ